MTKEQELQRVIEFARNLPDASYIKPWLLASIPEIKASMDSDIIPSVTILEEMAKVRELRDKAATLRAEIAQRTAENQALASACHQLKVSHNSLRTELEELGHRCLDRARPSPADNMVVGYERLRV